MTNVDVATTGAQGARNANMKKFDPLAILTMIFDENVDAVGLDKKAMYPLFREALDAAVKRQPLYLETVIDYWYDNAWLRLTRHADDLESAPPAKVPEEPKKPAKTPEQIEAAKQETEQLKKETVEKITAALNRKADEGIRRFFKYLQTLNREDALDRIDATHNGARSLIEQLAPGALVAEVPLDSLVQAYEKA